MSAQERVSLIDQVVNAITPEKFSWQEWVDWQDRYFWLFFVVLIVYIPGFKLGVWFMKDRKPFDCRRYMMLHNLIMCIFSTIGSFVASVVLYESVRATGLVGSVCDGLFYRHRGGVWMFLFSVSKIWELTETVVQVLEKKNIIFLHCAY